MKVQIQSVANRGTLEKERLVLKVLLDTDIGDYVLFRTGYSNGSVTTGIRNAFWFPDKVVSKGDLVVVYTKPGTNNERTRKNGSLSHFFYLNLDQPIWEDEKHALVILYVSEWESQGPDERSS